MRLPTTINGMSLRRTGSGPQMRTRQGQVRGRGRGPSPFKQRVLWELLSLLAIAASAWTMNAGVGKAADHPRPARPPVAKKSPVVDVYHGVRVTDDYRWLENWHDTAVRDWSDAENADARKWLARLPNVAAIRARVTQIMTAKTVSYSQLADRRGSLFAIKREPPKQQPFLIVMPSAEALAQARVLVDPNQIDPTGGTAIDWYVPSPDGSLVAVSLSHGGSEEGDVHLYRNQAAGPPYEVVPHVNSGTAGGDLAWMPDGSGFFYTHHSKADESRSGKEAPAAAPAPAPAPAPFQEIYFHKLGTAVSSDRYELGNDFPCVAESEFEMDNRTGTLLVTMQKGDGGEFSLFLRSPAGRWKQITTYADKIVQGTFGLDGNLYFISRAAAPRGKVLRVPLAQPDIARAETVIPEGPDTIVNTFYHNAPSLVPTAKRLYVLYQMGGPSELRVFDLGGKPLPSPQQLPVSTIGGLTRLDGNDVLFSNTSYTAPPAVYRFFAASGRTVKTQLATASPVDYGDVDVTREFATSKDGTRIPVNILYPKGTQRDGKSPALVTGYGGYAISMTPTFSAVRHVLLEQGFVYAIANLRGGSEYGEEWHRQGNLTHKQNVFDDFTAALKHLIDRKYTSSAHLAIEGGSNGGLLMGAMLTQHPDLMRVVVSHVGIYDMLRSELSPNGAFNVAEYGSVKNPEQFRALYAYSPYHHVVDGVRYPAVLFLTGANDPRVDAMQSRKMTARLQAANASGEPILLRTTSNTGHGLDSPLSERISETVDVFAFIFDRLGVTYRKIHPHASESR